MIEFTYTEDKPVLDEANYTEWFNLVADSEGFKIGDLNYVFLSDEELLDINRKYLEHDFYTDIITFDYTVDGILNGDIFISIDRVRENAVTYEVSFEEELRRVMIHGVLHLAGYKDSSKEDKEEMRRKENEKLRMFHVEQ